MSFFHQKVTPRESNYHHDRLCLSRLCSHGISCPCQLPCACFAVNEEQETGRDDRQQWYNNAPALALALSSCTAARSSSIFTTLPDPDPSTVLEPNRCSSSVTVFWVHGEIRTQQQQWWGFYIKRTILILDQIQIEYTCSCCAREDSRKNPVVLQWYSIYIENIYDRNICLLRERTAEL